MKLKSIARRAQASVATRVIRRANSLSLSEILKGRSDYKELVLIYPWLKEMEGAQKDFVERYNSIYREYTQTVSTPVMAASMETLHVLSMACCQPGIRHILDLGSGISSFILEHSIQPCSQNLVSIDDDPFWLDKTKEFSSSRHVRKGESRYIREPQSSHFYELWSDLNIEGRRNCFDLVFHDIGSMAFRRDVLPDVVKMTAPGGLILFDDVHKRDYRDAVESYAKVAGIRLFSLRSLTFDGLTRYAYLGIKE